MRDADHERHGRLRGVRARNDRRVALGHGPVGRDLPRTEHPHHLLRLGRRRREAPRPGPEAYDKLLAGLATLHESGSSVHPHNHRMFELDTGRQLTPPDVPKRVPGYAKQASLFYDVCRRHQACFADWFGTALRSFETLRRLVVTSVGYSTSIIRLRPK